MDCTYMTLSQHHSKHFKILAICAHSLTHTSHHHTSHLWQFGVHYFAQGHFNKQSREAGDQSSSDQLCTLGASQIYFAQNAPNRIIHFLHLFFHIWFLLHNKLLGF